MSRQRLYYAVRANDGTMHSFREQQARAAHAERSRFNLDLFPNQPELNVEPPEEASH